MPGEPASLSRVTPARDTERCGALNYDTHRCFAELGYTAMAQNRGVELLDLNEAPLRRRSLPGCTRWPEFFLPEIAYDSFLLSVPVLKAHTLADVTLTMKNMMGLAPPEHYCQGGGWKKAAFHAGNTGSNPVGDARDIRGLSVAGDPLSVGFRSRNAAQHGKRTSPHSVPLHLL